MAVDGNKDVQKTNVMELDMKLSKHLNATVAAVLPQLGASIDSFLVSYPHWYMAFHLAIGLYGYYIALKQEDVNEFVQYIKDNPSKYRREIVESKEFQDGFVVAFRIYLEVRIKEKRAILKRILEGYTETNSMTNFPLERLNDILLRISPEALRTLIFIKQNIIPLKEFKVQQEVENIEKKDPYHNDSWYLDSARKRMEISGVILSWIYENYNPNSPKVKKQYGIEGEWDKKIISDVFDIEASKNQEIFTSIDEFVGLGIMKIKLASGGGGMSMAGGSSFDFSLLGYQFIDYVENDDLGKRI